MAYIELIKNFERIRDYVRQFFVFGFKSRNHYPAKSARSYDNERRRIESWLGQYMYFRQEEGEKQVFLSVDSRAIPRNPLYNVFKAKSFTNGDIAFHFYIFDLLSNQQSLSIREIMEQAASRYLAHFPQTLDLDESTVRKKLKEYETLGLLESRRQGRELYYRSSPNRVNLESWLIALAFFSEEDPLGVVGSFLCDRLKNVPQYFGFKHHYILHALDSEILSHILLTISEKRWLTLKTCSERTGGLTQEYCLFPVKIYISTQSGRQYLLGYQPDKHKFMFFRLDSIHSVTAGVVEKDCQRYSDWYEKFKTHLWGVAISTDNRLETIAMTVFVEDNEHFIVERLKREKRCGQVAMISANLYRYSAQVYDARELLPWLRTFIGRIVKLECSNPEITQTFFADFHALNQLYEGNDNAI